MLRNLQAMPLDGDTRMADGSLVALGTAITEALGPRTRQWLAEAIDVDPSTVTRIIQGQMTNISVERINQIERTLGMKRGELLRAAGYVEADDGVEAAIHGDPVLNSEAKRSLLAVYRSLVDLSTRLPS